jgi:hypothetical protein
VLTKPWPSMLRGIWGDPERYKRHLLEPVRPKYYFAGDGAKYDADGNIWLLGRVDDVMNVSGHRLSTAEIESALVSHTRGRRGRGGRRDDETTGQAPSSRSSSCARSTSRSDEVDEGVDLVRSCATTSPRRSARSPSPSTIMIVSELPKTRSGKIMRRLLRDVAENREVGDVTTLADSSVMCHQAGPRRLTPVHATPSTDLRGLDKVSSPLGVRRRIFVALPIDIGHPSQPRRNRVFLIKRGAHWRAAAGGGPCSRKLSSIPR